MNLVNTYDSVGDYVAKGETLAKSKRGSSSSRGDSAWYGTANMDEAVKLVRGGWDKRPNLSKLSKDIDSQTSANIDKMAMEHQVQGAYVDVGAYLEGVPECMVEFINQPEPKVVTIAFNISTFSSMPEKAFANRGAVTLAICNKLQLAGYSVEIKAYCTVKATKHGEKRGRHTTVFTVKDSGQMLDEDSLAFWCCHPSALRRLHFLHNESLSAEACEKFGYNAGCGGYGTPCKLSEHPKGEKQVDADVNVDFQEANFSKAVNEYNKLIAKLNKGLAS